MTDGSAARRHDHGLRDIRECVLAPQRTEGQAPRAKRGGICAGPVDGEQERHLVGHGGQSRIEGGDGDAQVHRHRENARVGHFQGVRGTQSRQQQGLIGPHRRHLSPEAAQGVPQLPLALDTCGDDEGLRDGQRMQEEGPRLSDEESLGPVVVGIVGAEQGDDDSGIENDHSGQSPRSSWRYPSG